MNIPFSDPSILAKMSMDMPVMALPSKPASLHSQSDNSDLFNYDLSSADSDEESQDSGLDDRSVGPTHLWVVVIPY